MKGFRFFKFSCRWIFLYESKIRSPAKVDKGPSLAIKSYLKFCSITDTPQWQPDRHNTEARFELVDGIRDTTFGSDTEEAPTKKTVAKVKEAENIAELEGEVAKCCYICHPDHSPNSWPQDAQVSKIVKGFE